ncbi:MAG: glycoside hydrolase family 2 TIM barrel-domain containing protein [Caldilineaceae bacterium]
MSFRKRLSLDGPWQFQIDPAGGYDVSAIQQWREIQVPSPWQAQCADLRHASGVGWYRRTFTVDPTLAGAPMADAGNPDETQVMMLCFGAVDYQTVVWVNGQRVGEHEGGYLPFEFDIGAVVQAGENEVIVRVTDPTDDPQRWPTYPFSEIPHGKQSWYGPISGIWQSVDLEVRSWFYIRHLHLTPLVAKQAMAVTVHCSDADLPPDVQIQLRVVDPAGVLVAEETIPNGNAIQVGMGTAPLQLWSPATPALYTVTATLQVNGKVLDEVSATCGFRTVEARAGRIYLNGAPLYLRGALDQAYYPETIYTPPSLAFLEDQLQKAKVLGLNCLRCHIKIEDPRYYEVADRLGMLIWTEIPNWAHLSANASQRAKETFLRMVERDWNHPSIIAWTLVNENWGTDLARNPEHQRWLAEFYHEAKKIDPYRLIIDNSACEGNFHVASDLDDFHYYRAIPDHADGWDAWVADFADRADWAWADAYRHERHTGLPLIVSEFGNWGLPHPDAIQEGGRDPWWFETGQEWGDGIVYPHGMQERFHYWGLDAVFGDFDSFIRTHQAHMAHSLAYEISTMRLDARIGGYVITEFTDVHWECNGLMDMQRNLKAGLAEHFVPLNQDRVVVLRPQQWSGQPGERLPILVRAYDMDGEAAEGVIRWQMGDVTGKISAPGGVIAAPLTTQGMVTVTAQWFAADGALIAHNQVNVACVAPVTPQQPILVVDDPALATVLADLGYNLVTEAAPGVLLLAHAYTPAVQSAVQEGAQVLLIIGPTFATAEDSLRLPIAGVSLRSGTYWQGDWATSFSWLKKQGPFAHLPGSPLLEMDYAALMPDLVLTGIPAWAYSDRSWAGLALGWIHKPVSLLAKAAYGDGTITATTFKLTAETLRENVIAQALLQGVVTLAAKGGK